MPDEVALLLPPAVIERVVDAVIDQLEERGLLTPAPSPWLDVDQAADYLCCSGPTQRARRQRIYDLVSQGRLTPGRDGTRLLFRREQLDAYLDGHDQDRMAA